MPANPHYSLWRQEWGQSLGKEKEGRGMSYLFFWASLGDNHPCVQIIPFLLFF